MPTQKIIDAAIAVHHTATDETSAWDGPAEVAKASGKAQLHYMHAWVDDAGDPEAKQSYKFPHHNAGTDTAANIHGVNNALARLPQSSIPEADRAGVESHLKAHRKDAGLTDELSAEELQAILGDTPLVAEHPKHEPIRCFEGSAKPHEPFWRFHDAADGGEAEMELYGYISEYSWFEDEVTPKMFKNDLYAHGKGGPITVRLNSYGGDVIAASLMRTIIQDYPGRVTVQIDGMAASAATVVATAGDRVRIQDTAYYMIHDPMAVFMFAALNIEELGRLLDTLQTVKDGLVNAYEHKTGLPRLRLSRMMQDETWMSAQEAVDLGFANEIVTVGQKSALKSFNNTAFVNAISRYSHVPDALKAQAITIPPGDHDQDVSGEEPLPAAELTPREELRNFLDSFYERTRK